MKNDRFNQFGLDAFEFRSKPSPDEQEESDDEIVDQDPGERQKENQNGEAEDPLAA